MVKIVFSVFLVFALSGCATTSLYGNYLAEPARIDQTQLAVEAINQLAKLYPPARSRFELQQPTPDAFGRALTKGLREKGYAIIEFDPKPTYATTTSASDAPETTDQKPIVDVPRGTHTYSLRYIVDSAGESNLYRLTLLIDNQSLTRPYVNQDGTLVPAGYWVRLVAADHTKSVAPTEPSIIAAVSEPILIARPKKLNAPPLPPRLAQNEQNSRIVRLQMLDAPRSSSLIESKE